MKNQVYSGHPMEKTKLIQLDNYHLAGFLFWFADSSCTVHYDMSKRVFFLNCFRSDISPMFSPTKMVSLFHLQRMN